MNRAMTAALDMVGAALAKPGPDGSPPLTERQHIPASNRDAARDLVARMERRREREEWQRLKTSLINDFEAALRVLNDSAHGNSIPDDQIGERARNMTTIVLGNYDVRERT